MSTVDRLANLEEALRTRLHRAHNRIEDHDALDVFLARAGVALLDRVDRLTGFRRRHRPVRHRARDLPPAYRTDAR